jgi:hypothetical protein
MQRSLLRRGSLVLASASLICLVGACLVEPEPLPDDGPGGSGRGGSSGTAGKGGSAGAAGRGGSGGYGASGGTGGAGGGSSGTGGAGGACEGPNPAGCAANACPPNAVCDTTIGCLPSQCDCVDGQWACTDDCGGGVCVPVGPECGDATAAIGAEIAKFASCTAVVRLRHGSLVPLGWQLVCGEYGATSEESARAIAEEVTGFGAGGALLGGKAPADEWVFWDEPLDLGGVGVVSARSPFAVFGGGVIWDGQGEITHPLEWRDAAELGFACANSTPQVPARGLHLASGEPLSPGELEPALSAVYASALPAGLAAAHDVFDALVLLYPPRVGVLDPAVAEYVVLLNSGTRPSGF